MTKNLNMLQFMLREFRGTLNVDAPRYDGCTAVDLAHGLRLSEALDVLLRAGASDTTPLLKEEMAGSGGEEQDMEVGTRTSLLLTIVYRLYLFKSGPQKLNK